jgi:hypothetical protein
MNLIINVENRMPSPAFTRIRDKFKERRFDKRRSSSIISLI